MQPVNAEKDANKRQALLLQILKQKKAENRKDRIQIISGKDKKYPLSYFQSRIWFLEKYNPDSCIHNIPFCIKISGDLQVGYLEQAIQELIKKHAILRTSVVEENDEPYQMISDNLFFPLPVADYSARNHEDEQDLVSSMIHEEIRKKLVLSAGPLFRNKLCRFDDHTFYLILVFHHIIIDGSSILLFVKELFQIYGNLLHNDKPTFQPAEFQYVDFAVWQKKTIESGSPMITQQLDYWMNELKDSGDPLVIPTDKPRPAIQTYNGRRYFFRLTPDLSDDLKLLSNKLDVTLYMVLYSAFTVLLHRYTGQSRISVGTPFIGRMAKEFYNLLGPFINTLVLCSKISGDMGFSRLLQEAKNVVMNAFTYHEVPFDKLVEILKPQRDQSRPPFFQVMFNMHANNFYDVISPDLTKDFGLELAPVGYYLGVSEFDLSVDAFNDPDSVFFIFEYNVDLFEEDTIRNMTEHFKNILYDIVREPNQSIANLNLLTENERQQLLIDWNKTEKKIAAPLFVHKLFEKQASASPDKIACCTAEYKDIQKCDRLTYQDLNEQANQIASYVRKKITNSKINVGLFFTRSLTTVKSIFGIMKAALVFVPLDPDLPGERLFYILTDANIQVILTEKKYSAKLNEIKAKYHLVSLEIICIDTAWEEISNEPKHNPDAEMDPEDLVYILYTSGTTGKPKGVMIPHRALANHALAIKDNFSLQGVDRVLQFASLYFDVAYEEFFPSLISGAAVILRPNELPDSLTDFQNWINREKISVLNIPTSYWREWAEELESIGTDWPPALRVVIIGNEKVLPESVKKWFKCLGDKVVLKNAYGLTEATITSTVYDFNTQNPDKVAIGRPIHNVTTYILDDYLHPVPVNVYGNLFIGGQGLSLGYLNQPELTQNCFIPNPFSSAGGERLFMTGDRARYLKDGNLEFLDRNDYQVKIRGYRVELSEIEHTLLLDARIKEAAAVICNEQSANPLLVAFVVLQKQLTFTKADIIAMLKNKLPAYMLPSFLVILEKMPQTASGKLDRQALLNLDVNLKEVNHNVSLPKRYNSLIEDLLIEIWSELLDQKNIRPTDNFFELGGHSILATKLVSRVYKILQCHLPLRMVFEYPTVQLLAECIKKQLNNSNSGNAGFIQHDPQRNSAPLSFEQNRLWVINQLLEDRSVYNMSAAYRLDGPLNISAFKEAINKVVSRHEILQSVIQLDGEVPIQRVKSNTGSPLVVKYIHTEQHSSEQILLHIKESIGEPFDFNNGPLLRITLLSLSDTEHIAVFTFHHIIFDALSFDIFLEELAQVYKAIKDMTDLALPELPIQYRDYAWWQKEWFHLQKLEEQLTYWEQQLAGAPEVTSLPLKRQRPPVQTYHGCWFNVPIATKLSQGIKRLGREQGATPFMVLLAAFKVLLMHYTRQNDMVLGTPVSGRSRTELENLLGFFINSLVIRTELSGAETFLQLLKRIREITLKAQANSDIPFEKIVERLHPTRSLSHSAIFQIVFSFIHNSQSPFALSELKTTPVDIGWNKVMFDVIVEIEADNEGLTIHCGYNQDLFDGYMMETMMANYLTLLENIVAEPAQPVVALRILTPAQQKQLISRWNNPQTASYKQAAAFHKMCAAQVAKYPDFTALVFENQSLSYAGFHQKTNKLARYLQKKGVRRGAVVGLCVERSLEFFVGMLAILKAGGAYLPLEPATPEKRLDYMLKDTGSGLLLTQSTLSQNLKALDIEMLLLDNDWPVVEQEANADLVEDFADHEAAQNLAYVIYTSGSSGKPKGVAVRHQEIFNYCQSIIKEINPPQNASYAVVSTLAADLGHTMIFMSMLTGGCLHILTTEKAADGLSFFDYLRREKIDYVKIVPSHLKALQANTGEEAFCFPAKGLILGGEASEMKWIQELLAKPAPCRIINHYGPTETTVGVVTYAVDPEKVDFSLKSLPIGRPLAHVTVYILDHNLNPAPEGVPGELFIAGDSVAQGYINQPELTVERFLPDPFAVKPERRMYRTGDLVRMLPDGNLEFLGRIDAQIKIRGYRIEQSEIEQVLKSLPLVQDAAVNIVNTSSASESRKQLVAYLVPAFKYHEAINGKRRYRLPNNMSIVHLNKNETDYIYKEIFENQAYFQQLITLQDGDCVLDVGANIGLFTLFVKQFYPETKIYAFEPNPILYDLVKTNIQLYAKHTEVFPYGLADAECRKEFTSFSGFSLLSGFYTDIETEKQTIRSFVENQSKSGQSGAAELLEDFDDIVADRFNTCTFTVQLRTLSAVMKELDIHQIDLLKINVEKSELDILRGIGAADWEKIKQIVLEIDLRKNLDEISFILREKGYDIRIIQDKLLTNSELYYLYAKRRNNSAPQVSENKPPRNKFEIPVLEEEKFPLHEVKEHLRQYLPEYMRPDTYVLLEKLPVNANGKLDRKALPAPDQAAIIQESYIAPRNAVEESLAAIWRNLLQRTTLGIDNNFFDLGGHSLLATQLVARVRSLFQISLSLKSIFDHPTIRELAEIIIQEKLNNTDAATLARLIEK